MAAISRGLRDDPGIGEATRRKIQKVAKSLGYTRDAAGLALSTGVSRMITLLVPEDPAHYSRLFFSEVIEGAAEVLSSNGYTINLLYEKVLESRNLSAENAVRINKSGGLILLSLRDSDLHLIDRSISLPTVVVNAPGTDEIDAVFSDDREGARVATRHLFSLGHMRIAHIAGPTEFRSNIERRLGYSAALREAIGEAAQERIEIAEPTRRGGYSAMKSLLDRYSDTTAVLCCRDVMAVGALDALREHGKRVPDDVSVIGFDDEEYADLMTPPLTTVRKERKDMGRMAARILVERLEGVSAAAGGRAASNIIRTKLVKRNSTAVFGG